MLQKLAEDYPLPKVLLELVRVTFDRLVLIENKRTDQTAFGSAAHAGCWVHDMLGTFAKLGFANIQVLEQVLDDQDVYLVDLEPGATDSPVPEARLRFSIGARDAEIRRLRRDIERSRSELLDKKDRLDRLEPAEGRAGRNRDAGAPKVSEGKIPIGSSAER